ncbi:hypothetical protein [Brevibacterium senegalense]|uniref:hypothetical protein n=1 Tax=Brevibacterium senegalense TaxID=1033736 RepID=UPI00030BDAEC|nr:hypothetical protein [Brevibacterium senegalense]
MGLHHDRTAVARDQGESTHAAVTPLARSARGLLAAAGVAGALTLSGCGLLPFGQGTDEPCGSAQAGCVQVDPSTEGTDGAGEPPNQPTADSPEAGATTEAGAGVAGETDGADGAGGSGEEEEDWISTESLAGDSSVELDEDGTGTFPAEALEADIKDLFVNKFDVPVTEVVCAHDVSMYDGRGSGICDLETDERTYYGSVIIEQDEGELFKYELQFPGLDKDELDLD